MPTLNRNNSNWSFEERRKINENWEILENLSNQTQNGNSQLDSRISELKNELDSASATTNRAIQNSAQSLIAAQDALIASSRANILANDAIRRNTNTSDEVSGINNKLISVNNNTNIALTNSEQAVNIANEVQNQFDRIVSESDSNPEVVQARGDNPTLRARLDNETQELTQRIETVNVNPVISTEVNENITLGAELINSATVILGSGWSGDITNGFSHVAGESENLVFTFPTITPGSIYQVEINITNPANPDNGTSDYYLSLAGSPEFETYKGRATTRSVWGLKAISGNQLIVRPWVGYVGTIRFSVKLVSGTIEPHTIFSDRENQIVLEQRFTNRARRNLFMGVMSGRFSNEFAEQNVAIGDRSMANSTSAFWNVALGFETLRENTVGTRNIAIGRIALQQNVSGDRNVAIGSFALRDNVTGRSNIGIGADALYQSTSGDYNIGIGLSTMAINNGNNNIAIGERTMTLSTGGNNNIAFGTATLFYNDRGINNFAVGVQSMYRNLTGNHNIGIGRASLFFNTSGQNNIAFGQNSLQYNQSNELIAIGRNSMQRNESGTLNMAIGSYAMQENTTGSNNIGIGVNALYSNVTNTNNIAIGNSALYNNAANNNLAIGNLSQRDNVTGAGNLSVGHNTLVLNTASNNTAIGHNAGTRLTTGANNVFVGGSAGIGNNIGGNNVVIGYNALSKAVTATEGADLSRNVVIGYFAGRNLGHTSQQNVIIGNTAGSNLTTGSNNILLGNNVFAPTAISDNYLNIGGVIRSQMDTNVVEMQQLRLTALPTSEPTARGTLWNNNGVLSIS